MTKDHETSLREAFQIAQICPPSNFEATGNITRYTLEGDRPTKQNGWYLLFDDGDFSCCVFGCWTQPYVSHKWLSRDAGSLTPAERVAWKARQDTARRKRDQERQKLWAQQRVVFAEIMENAHQLGIEDHPYIKRKRITPVGGWLSEHRGTTSIVIPRYKGGELVGLQKIEADGSKKYMYGTESQGSYTILPGNDSRSTILVCEGWATGCSLHEALDTTVVVAFDAGNILPTVKSIVEQYPINKVVICADDDHEKEVNTGLIKATEAGKKFGLPVLTPEFVDGSGLSDFNDMATEQGSEAVKNYICNTVEIHPEAPVFLNGNELLAAPLSVSWLIHRIIERDTLIEVFGAPGSGKSFVTIDMALSVACGVPWAGNIVRQGMVVYFAGEGFGGLSRRIKAWHFNQPCDLSWFHLSRRQVEFSPDSLNRAAAEIRDIEVYHGVDVAMVVIDTLARHMMGDENSTADMGTFVRTVDKFREAFPLCAVMLVHHTGHSTGDRSRGSSVLKGAVESEIQCAVNKEGIRTLTWTKMKDGEAPKPLEFTMNRVVLGEDDFGGDISSCWLTYAEYEKKEAKQQGDAPTGTVRIGIEAFTVAESASYDGHVDESVWREAFEALYRKKRNAKSGSVRTAWSRLMKDTPEIWEHIEGKNGRYQRVLHTSL